MENTDEEPKLVLWIVEAGKQTARIYRPDVESKPCGFTAEMGDEND